MNAKERDAILSKYLTMKSQAADLEGEISLLRDTILKQIPSGQYQDTLVLIQEQERESFEWKKAQAVLSDAVKQKLLPFVKVSKFPILKVQKVGGK